MLIYAFLPFLSLILLFLIFSCRKTDSSHLSMWREAWINACVTFGFILVTITQFLSIFTAFTFGAVFGFWISTSLILGMMLNRMLRRGWSIKYPLVKFTPYQYFLIGGMAILALILAIVAFLAPPNNWDSLVYHMTRVMHWIQNKSIAFYPTHCLRQNHQNGGSEMFILHLQILAGGDRFANFVQYFSMIGSVIGVSLIAKYLGARTCGQLLAALFGATFPMGILQATSSQADYAVSFWIVCFAVYLTRFVVQASLPARIDWSLFLGIGASLGLAVLTKATTYLIALPFLIWFGILLVKRLRWRLIAPAAIITAVFLFINGFNYYRNMDLYGHLLGPALEQGNVTYYNDIMAPKAQGQIMPRFVLNPVTVLMSNIVRNIALHFTIGEPHDPKNPSNWRQKLEDTIQQKVRDFCTAIGTDPDEKRTSWPGQNFVIPPLIYNDENDGNPIHMVVLGLVSLILLIAIPVWLIRRQHDAPWNLALFWACGIMSFLIFCMYLRWQPWHSRLHIVLFLLYAPVIGCVMDWIPRGALGRRLLLTASNAIALLMLIFAFPWAVNNMQRSLNGGPYNVDTTSREDLRFNYNLPHKDKVVEAVNLLKEKNCKNIGLLECAEPWEYLIWCELKERVGKDVVMRHVMVDLDKENPSSKFYQQVPHKDFVPDAIFVAKQPGPPPPQKDTITWNGNEYDKIFTADENDVYLKKQ